MKKWSLVVAALYGLILVALFIPVTAIAFIKKSNIDMKWPAEAFRDWGVWLIIAALVTAQFALLRVPVAVANRRPVALDHCHCRRLHDGLAGVGSQPLRL